MNDHPLGTLLALDDGYGSLTDQDLEPVAAALRSDGRSVVIIDYHRPDMPSGYFVSRYQAGIYGQTTVTNPYIGVLLHAVDYFDSAHEVRDWLAAGKTVLAINFYTSTVAQEAHKFLSQPERAGFYLWADQILFETFGLTRPIRTILLGGNRNRPALKAQYQAEMAGVLSRDIKIVDCYRAGKRLPDNEINRLLVDALRDILPENAPQDNITDEPIDVWIPEVSDELAAAYQATITEIIQQRSRIDDVLADVEVSEEKRQIVWQLLTPIALDPIATSTFEIAGVPQGYSQDHRTVRLLSIAPKNEFDLLPGLLFEHTDLSSAELTAALEKMKFEQKEELFRLLVTQKFEDGANNDLPVNYTFELLTTYETFRAFQELLPEARTHAQALTPRYEYELPEVIEENNVTDEYLDCFDKSMELYSQLEAAGQGSVAANACLRGHKLRWRVIVSYEQLMRLIGSQAMMTWGSVDMYEQIKNAAFEHHPLLMEWVRNQR